MSAHYLGTAGGVIAQEGLDYGWGLPTRKEALKDRTLGKAIEYMLGETMQTEINNIVSCAKVNSLDGERKINVSKPTKHKGRTPSVAFQSCHALHAAYLREREAVLAERAKLLAQAKKDRFINPWTLATQRFPDKMRMSTGGRLAGRGSVDLSHAHEILQEGDVEWFRSYVETHKAELRRTCEQMRWRV